VPRPHAGPRAIGMKMYLALAPGPAALLDCATELTLFPGGYAGLQCVEDGKAVLCIAVQRQAFQRYGGDWAGLLSAITARSRRFAVMMTGARPLLRRPLAVAGIPYGYQARTNAGDGLFRLGDQAAVIPSLTGDGLAIALCSGQQAAEAWLIGADAALYQHSLARMLAPQMRLAGWLHHGGLSTLTQSVAIHLLGLFPGLLRQAATRTRLPAGAILPWENPPSPARIYHAQAMRD
jgi:flavin-dependent dehydrogenase